MSLPVSSDEARPVRLHISPLSRTLAKDPSDLVSRLSIFGTPLSKFSIHKKPALDTSFAFITLSLTKQQYSALRKSLNGVKFKGAVINIQESSTPDFHIKTTPMQTEEERELDNEAQLYKKRALALREQRTLQRHLYHVRKGHYEFGRCLRGRLRESERDVRQGPPTFRVKIGNKVKTVKCKKQKLWGRARGGNANDLIWKFVDDERHEGDEAALGQWVNGNGDVVEFVKKTIVSNDDFAMSNVEPDDDLTESLMDNDEIEIVPLNPGPAKESAEAKIQRLENEKNLKIFQDIFGQDQQETLPRKNQTRPEDDENTTDEDDDDDAIFDIVRSETQTNMSEPNGDAALDIGSEDHATTIVGDYGDNQTDKVYDSDSLSADDNDPGDSDIESDGKSSSSDSEPEQKSMEHAAEDQVQTVAPMNDTPTNDSADVTGPTKKNVVTERLRSLFNPDESTGSFSLLQNSDGSDYDSEGSDQKAEGAEDEHEEANSYIEQTEKRSSSSLKQPHIVGGKEEEGAGAGVRSRPPPVRLSTTTTRTQTNVPLLFPHTDSAFLDAQTQFSRGPMQPTLSRSDWEKEFYEKRGEWMRKAKRRRRDVIRMVRRKEGNGSIRHQSGNKQTIFDSGDGIL
ncbi:hypothetical protein V1509DRAFT_626524 [Lipomyces kononenkoae]